MSRRFNKIKLSQIIKNNLFAFEPKTGQNSVNTSNLKYNKMLNFSTRF